MAEEKEPEHNTGLPTTEEIEAAIDSSGYLLEGRIARVMAERGFFVEPNYFTPDPVQAGKAIEIDVAARYFEWVNEANNDTVSASVLVECKNNSQPVAFFVRHQQLTKLNDSRIHYGGFPSFSMDPDAHTQVPLHKLLQTKDWHHYCLAEEVATQFCSFERKNKKLKAAPNENYSGSFSKLAVVAATDSADAYGLHLQCIQVHVAYPVVVFQGPIYRVADDNSKANVEAVDRLQLHHAATVNGRLIQAQIDVVTESPSQS